MLEKTRMARTDTPLAPWQVAADAFPVAGGPEDRLRFVLGYAVLAPSGHNTQPWRYAVDGEAVEVYADRAQALPVVDPNDRELTISCGAALLNLRVALRRFGYRDDTYELEPDDGDADLLARVRLVEGDAPSPGEVALFDAIPNRRTTRAAYETRAVPRELGQALAGDAVREGAWLQPVPETARQAIAELIAEGDRAQMADERFRRELAAWVHSNRSRASRGMRGYGFGFSDLVSRAGPLVIRTFDLGKGQAARDRELAEHAPLLIVLGTDADTPRAWLEAGQALQRILLHACAHGLTASFLNQPVEVDHLRPLLAEAIGRGGGYPQLVLRLGYGPDVPHSPRVAVDDVLGERPRDG